jgi:hypothetical protein
MKRRAATEQAERRSRRPKRLAGLQCCQEFAAEEVTLSDWNDKVAAVGIVELRAKFRRALAVAVAERTSQDRKRC